METYPVCARKWYCERLDEIGTESPLIVPVHDGVRSNGISRPMKKALRGSDGMKVKPTNEEKGSVTGAVTEYLESNETTLNHAAEFSVKPIIVGGDDLVVCTYLVMEQVTSVGPYQYASTTSQQDEVSLGANLEPEMRDDRIKRAHCGQNLK
jgi:hypothetical protein